MSEYDPAEAARIATEKRQREWAEIERKEHIAERNNLTAIGMSVIAMTIILAKLLTR